MIFLTYLGLRMAYHSIMSLKTLFRLISRKRTFLQIESLDLSKLDSLISSEGLFSKSGFWNEVRSAEPFVTFFRSISQTQKNTSQGKLKRIAIGTSYESFYTFNILITNVVQGEWKMMKKNVMQIQSTIKIIHTSSTSRSW